MASSLRLGDVCPDFDADTTCGKINFHKYIEGKWALLMSHPADFTPVCTTEIGTVALMAEEWEKRDVLPLIISVDSVSSHVEWVKEVNKVKNTEVKFPLIGDENKEVSIAYGMLDKDEEVKGLPLTVRSVFIIGPDKKIKLILVYPASTGRNFDEIVRVIDSLQITANRSLTTPANWQKGDRLFLSPGMSDEAAAQFADMQIVSKSCKIRSVPDPDTVAKEETKTPEAPLEAPDATVDDTLSKRIAKPSSIYIPGLYTINKETGVFTLNYSETGVPYGETEKTSMSASISITLPLPVTPVADAKLELKALVRDQINFAGKWVVKEVAGEISRDISIPGLLTYDVGGRTGDPHASERVGGACAKQAVLSAQALLAAALYGASADQLDQLFQAFEPVIAALHGRFALNLWMKQQIIDAVVLKKDPVGYPDFFRARLEAGEESLEDAKASGHAKDFLESGTLPDAFFRKLGLK